MLLHQDLTWQGSPSLEGCSGMLHLLPISTTEKSTDTSRREYLALFGSLILIFLEGFIGVVTLGLRMYEAAPFLPF